MGMIKLGYGRQVDKLFKEARKYQEKKVKRRTAAAKAEQVHQINLSRTKSFGDLQNTQLRGQFDLAQQGMREAGSNQRSMLQYGPDSINAGKLKLNKGRGQIADTLAIQNAAAEREAAGRPVFKTETTYDKDGSSSRSPVAMDPRTGGRFNTGGNTVNFKDMNEILQRGPNFSRVRDLNQGLLDNVYGGEEKGKVLMDFSSGNKASKPLLNVNSTRKERLNPGSVKVSSKPWEQYLQ